MSGDVITVIGSTGNIGRELVDLLSDEEAPVRAVLRNTRRIRTVPGVVWIKADVTDESLLKPLLAGTSRLFLLTGNKPGFGRIQINVIRTAESLGVKHVVKLSALGASPRTRAPLALEHWEAVGYREVAEAISKATGTPVVYHSLSMEEMRERMKQQGMNEKMIDSYLALAAYQKAGGPTARVSESVAEILGRPARTVEDFANDYREYFE